MNREETEFEKLIKKMPRTRRRKRRRAGKVKVTHADGRTEVVSPGHFRKPVWITEPRKQGRKRQRAYAEYLQSPHWRQLRASTLQRDGHRCVACGAPRYLQVHHLTYARIGRELDEDVVTLCRSCHKRLHRG